MEQFLGRTFKKKIFYRPIIYMPIIDITGKGKAR